MSKDLTPMQEARQRRALRILESISPANRPGCKRAVEDRANAGLQWSSTANFVQSLAIADAALGGKGFLEATADDLRVVVSAIRERRRTQDGARTCCVEVAAHLKALRGLGPKDHLPRDLDTVLRLRKGKRRKHGHWLTDEQWRCLVDTASEPGDWISARNVAMLWVGIDAGFRPSELLSLRVGDVRLRGIELAHATLREGHGDLKTGEREEPVPLALSVPCLRAWLAMRGPETDADAPLWPAHQGDPDRAGLSYSAYAKAFKAISNASGINRELPSEAPLHPHDLRHSAASRDALTFTPSEMCAKYGWTEGSKEMWRYIHRRRHQLEQKVLAGARRDAGITANGFPARVEVADPAAVLARALGLLLKGGTVVQGLQNEPTP